MLFHDLRRSAVRNMERAGVPRKIAMQISGHKTESVLRRYGIISAQDMKLAAARIETYLGQFYAKTANSSRRRHRPGRSISEDSEEFGHKFGHKGHLGLCLKLC